VRWRVERVAQCASTNDVVRERAASGEPEGLVLVAARQTAGRGRAGRAWTSPAGGLWVSILARPRRASESWPLLSLLAANAVAEACRQEADLEARVKWPNDVLAPDGRKLAGILAESRPPDFAILGLGVNVAVDPGAFPAEARAASLADLAAKPVAVDAFLDALLDALAPRLEAFERGDDAALLAEARARSATLGRRIRTQDGRSGYAVDIDDAGHLLLRDDAGRSITLVADDVHLERE